MSLPVAAALSTSSHQLGALPLVVGSSTERKLPAAVLQAEEMYRNVEKLFKESNFSEVVKVVASQQELVDVYSNCFKGCREQGHLNACLGRSYCVLSIVEGKRQEKDLELSAREQAVKYLHAAVSTQYHHPDEVVLKYELAFQAATAAKSYASVKQLEKALRGYSLAAEMLESILVYTKGEMHRNSIERCAYAHSGISGTLHHMGLEKAREPHLLRSLELFQIAVRSACSQERYAHLQGQVVYQSRFLGAVYKVIGDFEKAQLYFNKSDEEYHTLRLNSKTRG